MCTNITKIKTNLNSFKLLLILYYTDQNPKVHIKRDATSTTLSLFIDITSFCLSKLMCSTKRLLMCSCSTSKPTQPAVLSFRFSTKVDPKFSTSSKIYRVTSPLDQLLKFLKLVSRGFIMLTFAKVLVLIMVHLLC